MDEQSKTMVGKLIEELTQQRDELGLQMHLAGMDAKDQLAKLEEKFFQLRQQFAPAKEAVDDSADDVWDALKLLGSEIKEGFDRIRKSFD
jgi:chromosome segregation ATPase